MNYYEFRRPRKQRKDKGKKRGNAVARGAKIGAISNGSVNAISTYASGRLLGLNRKAALGAAALGGAQGAIGGGIIGAGFGAGVRAVNQSKKKRRKRF
jgi:hypothetical protein